MQSGGTLKKMMKLIKFRVTEFRSVDDSDWVEVDKVTAFIGTNESGKTNLLLPLWKLKPAKNGEINLMADSPRKRFSAIRSMDDTTKPVFIQAHFELSDSLANQIATMTGGSLEEVRIACVQRTLAPNSSPTVFFPNASSESYASNDEIVKVLTIGQADITSMTVATSEETFKEDVLAAIKAALTNANIVPENITSIKIKEIIAALAVVDTENNTKRFTIAPRYGQIIVDLSQILGVVLKPSLSTSMEARDLVWDNVPSFVYYSNYGNLDSEIYLPHVIQNMTRTSVGSKEEAKTRTLKVLFEFVKLEPVEILELGREFPVAQGQPSEEQVKVIAEKKKERDILLQSAGTELTRKFRAWWKQGDYRFRFQADGDHFRIWVSDDRRPEDIELEGRSTGLQWFLSFFLIFLVESADSHENAILLLDEPGLSLHPLAQRDLSAFFENLANTNQLLYTTHSPFLVDPDHLDRVKAVYVNNDGTTAVSANLRAGESDSSQTKSIYPVFAALGLSVSDTLLQGCQCVIVEGQSDQHYLSAIKSFLIGKGQITPKRELIFIPGGGAKGINAIVPIITGKDEALPYVILDSDASGQTLAKHLADKLYANATDKIIMIGEFCNLPNTEIEDMFPSAFLAKIITQYLRGPEVDFADVVEEGKPIVDQVQKYVETNNHKLVLGWKVEIAMKTKIRLLKEADTPSIDDATLERWRRLFERLGN